jgi:hypothetical protein
MYDQCPGVDGEKRHTSQDEGTTGTVTIVTHGGIVITVMLVGTIVFGPIVMTVILVGIARVVTVVG